MAGVGEGQAVGLAAARVRGALLRRGGLSLALCGQPGVGKTYAAEGILRQSACRSFSLPAAAQLGLMVRAIPRPDGRKTLPAWAEALLERLASGGAEEPARTAAALGALLQAHAPAILHLEDLHEADPERLELLRHLAPVVGRSRGVVLLVTSRAAPPPGFETFWVEPLNAGATRALLEREVGGALPEAAKTWVFARAGGNPLFSLEYLRFLARQGYLWSDGRRWHWREPSGPEGRVVPVTVEALIERMIHDSDRLERDILEALALLPPDPLLNLLSQVAGVGPEEMAVAETRLEARGLLRGGRFVHPLFREVGLAQIPPARRQVLARRALEALRPADLVAAARYATEAGLGAEEALELLLAAAEEAGGLGNGLRAAELTAQAARHARPEQRAELALRAAEGLRPFSLVRATEAARLALEARPEHAEAAFLLAELLAQQGLQAEVEATLRLLPPGQREGPEWPLRLLRLRAALEDHAGVASLWDERPELRHAPKPQTVVMVADALLFLGRFDEAASLVEETLTNPELGPLEQALLWRALGRARFYAGRLDDAVRLIEAALPHIRRHSPGHQTALTLVRLGITRHYQGRHGAALEALEAGMAEFTRLGDGRWCAVAKHHMGNAYVGLGRLDRGEELFLEAYDYLARLGPSDSLVNVANALAWYCSHGGTPMSRLLGLKYARAAHAAAQSLGSVRAVLNAGVQLSLALTFTGDPRQGLIVAEEALRQLRRMDYPFILALTLEAHGLALAALGQTEAALASWAEAEGVLGQSGSREDAVRLRLRSAVLRGDRAAADGCLEEWRARGMVALLELVRLNYPELFAPEPRPAPAGKNLRLEVLGPMQVRTEGRAVPLRGGKRQELLALLLETRLAGRRGAEKLELLDALYPGEPEERAGAALRDLVSQVRSQLGAGLLETTPSGYALGAGLASDAESFLESGDTRLWRGVYLEGLSPQGRDEAVREGLYLALRRRAEAQLEDDPKESARVGRLLLEADPYGLDSLRLALRALRAGGNHRSLGRVYAEAKARMLEVGEVLPEGWAQFLVST